MDVNKVIFGNKVLAFIEKCREFKCRANFTLVLKYLERISEPENTRFSF